MRWDSGGSKVIFMTTDITNDKPNNTSNVLFLTEERTQAIGERSASRTGNGQTKRKVTIDFSEQSVGHKSGARTRRPETGFVSLSNI